MCCFDKSKCKLQPPAAPRQAGTHRSVEIQTPSLGKGAGQAQLGEEGETKVPLQTPPGWEAGKGR